MKSFGQEFGRDDKAEEQSTSGEHTPQLGWHWVLLLLVAVAGAPWFAVLVWFGIRRLSVALSAAL